MIYRPLWHIFSSLFNKIEDSYTWPKGRFSFLERILGLQINRQKGQSHFVMWCNSINVSRWSSVVTFASMAIDWMNVASSSLSKEVRDGYSLHWHVKPTSISFGQGRRRARTLFMRSSGNGSSAAKVAVACNSAIRDPIYWRQSSKD